MRIRSVTAIVVTVLAATATPAGAEPGPAPESWAKYVSAPSSRDVKPVRVLAMTGAVTNPGL